MKPPGGAWRVRLPITLFAVALATELSFRFVIFGSAAMSVEKLDSVHELGRSGLIEAAVDRELVYQLKPRLNVLFKLARLRTNADGLADDEYARDKPEGVFRIAVIGSSYSMPAGVALEESWHGILERDLNAHGGHRRVEIVNFAVGGYDSRQMAAALRARAARYHPDLALVDVTRSSPFLMHAEAVYRSPFEAHDATHPFFHSFVLERVVDFGRPTDATLPPELSRPAFERALGELSRIAEAFGIPLCFVILQHEPPDLPRDIALREAVARTGSCVVDTAPAFRGESFERLRLYAGDPHPNARAHAIFERVIAGALRTRGMVPASS